MSQTIIFHKYHGIGNDFIIIDQANIYLEDSLLKSWCQSICNRHSGVGGDGVLIYKKISDATASMRIINADGSEPEMCGNGIRCFTQYLVEHKGVSLNQAIKIDTLAGPILPEIIDLSGSVCHTKVNMGTPILSREHIPVKGANKTAPVINETIQICNQDFHFTAVSMGNPHAVVFVESLDNIELHKIGPEFENHVLFPKGINTEFVEVLSKNKAKMKVWERGSGPTLACGTGACAILVAGVLNGYLDEIAEIQLPGGNLQISWPNKEAPVWMKGPSQFVFSGEVTCHI